MPVKIQLLDFLENKIMSIEHLSVEKVLHLNVQIV